MKATAQSAFEEAANEREAAEAALAKANSELAAEKGSVSDLQVCTMHGTACFVLYWPICARAGPPCD